MESNLEKLNKAVFLDRDGTLIEDNGYLCSHRDIKILPGARKAVRLLTEHGYKVVVVSNQAGIARGKFTEDMLQTIDKTLFKEFLNAGGIINALYYCPHHPEHGVYPYQQNCDCRKPNPGMIKKALSEHNIDLKHSFMIGDRSSDIMAGQTVGLKSVLVLTGAGSSEKTGPKNAPDFVAPDLLNAVEWILSQNGNRKRT